MFGVSLLVPNGFGPLAFDDFHATESFRISISVPVIGRPKVVGLVRISFLVFQPLGLGARFVVTAVA